MTVHGWRLWRSPTEVRREIEEEIRFHLEQRARELEARGLPPEAAREKARELFGRRDRAALECLTVQMGDATMLQGVQWAVIGALTLGLLVMGLTGVVAVQRQAETATAREAALLQEQVHESMKNAPGDMTPQAPELVAYLWRHALLPADKHATDSEIHGLLARFISRRVLLVTASANDDRRPSSR